MELMTGLVLALTPFLLGMAANATIRYSQSSIQPARFPEKWRTDAIVMAPGTYSHGLVVGKCSNLLAANEVQTVQITGSPSGGSFILSFNGFYTSALPYNITAAALATALQTLPSVTTNTPANVAVSQNAQTYTITFQNQLGSFDQPQLVLVANSLTGGVTPNVIISTTTPGNNVNGVWEPYLSTNTDGSQIAKGVLIYDTIVDTFGSVQCGGGEWRAIGQRTVPVCVGGALKTYELTGLDANAVAQLGRILDGSIGNPSDPGTILEII